MTKRPTNEVLYIDSCVTIEVVNERRLSESNRHVVDLTLEDSLNNKTKTASIKMRPGTNKKRVYVYAHGVYDFVFVCMNIVYCTCITKQFLAWHNPQDHLVFGLLSSYCNRINMNQTICYAEINNPQFLSRLLRIFTFLKSSTSFCGN